MNINSDGSLIRYSVTGSSKKYILYNFAVLAISTGAAIAHQGTL